MQPLYPLIAMGSVMDSVISEYGYFRLIRARTERFDLRYDSGVWFGGMIRGMIRGYDSRRGKPSYQHWPGIEPWA